MSELSILELETEHAELLPERETLFLFGNGNFSHNTNISHNVSSHQTAVAIAHGGSGFFAGSATASAANSLTVVN
jgi:hypothetical protein